MSRLPSPSFSRRRALLGLAAVAGAPVLLAGCESAGSIGSIGPALTDDEPLSNDVRAALAAAPETALAGIRVKTLPGGRIRLSGAVDQDAVRQRAEQVAAGVAGVQGVVNTLQIR